MGYSDRESLYPEEPYQGVFFDPLVFLMIRTSLFESLSGSYSPPLGALKKETIN